MPEGMKCRTRSTAGLVFIALISLIWVSNLPAAITYDTIALSDTQGTLGPDLGAGVEFKGFGFPVLNAAGEVASVGTLMGTGVNTSNDRGIWSNVGGTIATVAREGSDGPGPGVGAGVEFSQFDSTIAFNNSGEVAFKADLSGTGVDSSNRDGIWTNTGGTLAVVAREGSDGPGPGVGAGVEFSTFGVTPPLINTDGKIAFWGALRGTGVDASNNRGIWTYADGTLEVVARSGSTGPGPNLGVGIDFSQFSSTIVLNDAGTLAFFATLVGTGVDSSNDTGIWTDAGGTLAAVARSGSAGPGPGLGDGVFFDFLNPPAINDAGELAFRGILIGSGIDTVNDKGVWKYNGAELVSISRSGTDGPLGPGLGSGVSFGFTGDPILNTAGEVVFIAELSGSGVDATNDTGIWKTGSGSPTTLARAGTDGPLGPGEGTGVTFSSFDFDGIVTNPTGMVVFEVALSGTGVSSFNNRGLWASVNGNLQKIVREGDPFDVDPGLGVDLRTISSMLFDGGSGGEDGRGLSFNDQGLLTFTLRFDDGTEGIFTASLLLPGDLNADGFVGVDDLNIILLNWNQNVTPSDLSAGDANGDGFVGVDDLNVLLINWNAGTPPEVGAVIPEPGTAAVFWVGVGMVLRRRHTAC